MGVTVGKKYKGEILADEIGLPVISTGLILPCGASARWNSVNNQ
jgi:23S rRNA (cytosine1962-C5)-methyltransferase